MMMFEALGKTLNPAGLDGSEVLSKGEIVLRSACESSCDSDLLEVPATLALLLFVA